jgi:CubicO group peptidase (beta-lactamase class C family)
MRTTNRFVVLALASALAGCGSTAPSTSPTTRMTVHMMEAAPPRAPEEPVAYRFVDPDRKARLAAAWPVARTALEKRLAEDAPVGYALAVTVDGEVAFEVVHGQADLEASRPVTAETRFRIGSIAKTVTTLALARLRDDGALHLDDRLVTHLPELGDTSGARDARIDDVLIHASGLVRTGDYDEVPGGAATSAADMIRSMRTLPFIQQSNRSYAYSNYAFSLLGLVVERRSGKSYRAFVDAEILAPLGLPTASWSQRELPAPARARSYATPKDATPRPIDEVELGAATPSGGLYWSARDLARWGAHHAGAYASEEAAGPVRASTVRALLTPRVDPKPVADGVPIAHALGWDTKDACGRRIVWKAGGLEGFSSLVAFLPHEGIAIASSSNSSTPLWKKHALVLDALAATGALEPRVLAPSPKLVDAARRYLALYDGFSPAAYEALYVPYFRSVISADDHRAGLERRRAEVGACRLGEAESVASLRAATFELICDSAKVSLSVELDARGERIAVVGWSTKKALALDASPPKPCEPPWK